VRQFPFGFKSVSCKQQLMLKFVKNETYYQEMPQTCDLKKFGLQKGDTGKVSGTFISKIITFVSRGNVDDSGVS